MEGIDQIDVDLEVLESPKKRKRQQQFSEKDDQEMEKKPNIEDMARLDKKDLLMKLLDQ